MDKIKLRQICFYFACMAPVSKLFIYPATLAFYARNDLLLAAGLNFAAQALVIGAVLWLSLRTDMTFFELLQARLGKTAARAVYCVLALFLLFAALLPVLEQRIFVTQVLYENEPSVLAFTPFFIVSFYAGMRGLKTLGRAADIALPLFAVSFTVLLLLAAPHADLGALLPVGRTGTGLYRGALYGLNWYADCIAPLFFLGNFKPEKKQFAKVGIAFAAGAAAVLLFLALFYGVFEDIAVLRQNSVAHISKYTTSFTSLGRIDFLFVFCLTIIQIFNLCVPVQLSTYCLRTALPRLPAVVFAAGTNLALLLSMFLLQDSFLDVQDFITQKMWAVFLAFCYILPVAAHLLCGRKRRADHG